MVRSLLGRLGRRLRRPAPAAGPPAWQKVRSGPLAGLELYLPTDDRPKSWVMRMLNGEYERRLVAEIESLAQGGGVFYDIGGHVAFFSCAWLRLGGERAEIFEPVPANAARIEETLARNGFEHTARVHHHALGDFDGEAVLVQNSADIGLASMSHLEGFGTAKMRRQTTNTRVTVDVRRLDGLATALDLPAPRVVKIDVEGAESQVVDGAMGLLGHSLPVIFCEMHAIESAVQTAIQLANLSFTAERLEARGGMPVFRFDPRAAGSTEPASA